MRSYSVNVSGGGDVASPTFFITTIQEPNNCYTLSIMNLKETYSTIAEERHKDQTSDSWWTEGTDTFISLLPKGSRVLGAGCGAGTKSSYLARKGLKVVGIDFSEKLIDIVRRENTGEDYIVMDMVDAHTLEGEFDSLFAQASLLHITKKDAAIVLLGFVSKLTTHGLLYIAVKGVPLSGIEEGAKEEYTFGYPYQNQRFFSNYSLD